MLQSYFPDVELQYTRFERSEFHMHLRNMSGMWNKTSLSSYKHIAGIGAHGVEQLQSVKDGTQWRWLHMPARFPSKQ